MSSSAASAATPAAHSQSPLAHLVGNTPLLAIRFRFRGRERTLYAKAESFNFTGSIKDRMALHILRTASQCGALAPNSLIAEATSGNTGVSFAAIPGAPGRDFHAGLDEPRTRGPH
jgi:cysteine synthase A